MSRNHFWLVGLMAILLALAVSWVRHMPTNIQMVERLEPAPEMQTVVLKIVLSEEGKGTNLFYYKNVARIKEAQSAWLTEHSDFEAVKASDGMHEYEILNSEYVVFLVKKKQS